ncbi:MAG: RidA family protein [Pseudomonadota bacterium]
MNKRSINPSLWLQEFGINHGVEVTGAQRTLYLSGQTSTSADGTPQHQNDIVAQFTYAWENVVDALREAGMDPSNVVRLNMYTTDVDAIMGSAEQLFGLITNSGCQPCATLLGVDKLYHPSIMIELEATAVA